MHLLALWLGDCGDDSFTDSKCNRHCDVTRAGGRAVKLGGPSVY